MCNLKKFKIKKYFAKIIYRYNDIFVLRKNRVF